MAPRIQRLALIAILLLGLVLRLKGLHSPLLDHPGWRQGDEAAIARNFATVDMNPLHPQADYNGPGPNYVELELQIVPWLAAVGYKIFGVHEVFGRLLSIAASLGTVATLFFFGRWLFLTPLAGLAAALLYAVAPGAIYYGRTFQPDTTMAFFLTAALFAGTRMLVEDDEKSWRRLPVATLLLLGAILAKSVAVLAIIPLIAVSVARFGALGTLKRPQSWVYLLGAVVPFVAYDHYETSIASWRWASGITKLHVIPSFIDALTSPAALMTKLTLFTDALQMLAHTMLGPVLFGLLILAFLTPLRSRSPMLLLWWLIADLFYAYTVVTVERVDYYLYPFVPLAALAGGAYLAATFDVARWNAAAVPARRMIVAGLAIALAVTIAESRTEIADYYEYNPSILKQARLLNTLLPPNALIVLGHLDPSVLYYIHRRGWEEDAYLWTPFDEQSAIAKGSRFFIAAEPARLARNVELSNWLLRFPLMDKPAHTWAVYVTDPQLQLPHAEEQWRAFRAKEKASKKDSPALPEDSPGI